MAIKEYIKNAYKPANVREYYEKDNQHWPQLSPYIEFTPGISSVFVRAIGTMFPAATATYIEISAPTPLTDENKIVYLQNTAICSQGQLFFEGDVLNFYINTSPATSGKAAFNDDWVHPVDIATSQQLPNTLVLDRNEDNSYEPRRYATSHSIVNSLNHASISYSYEDVYGISHTGTVVSGSVTLDNPYPWWGTNISWEATPADGYEFIGAESTYRGTVTAGSGAAIIEPTVNPTPKSYSVVKHESNGTVITVNNIGTFDTPLTINIGGLKSANWLDSATINETSTTLSYGNNSYTMTGTYYSEINIYATGELMSIYNDAVTTTGIHTLYPLNGHYIQVIGNTNNLWVTNPIKFSLEAGYQFPISIRLCEHSSGSTYTDNTILVTDCTYDSQSGLYSWNGTFDGVPFITNAYYPRINITNIYADRIYWHPTVTLGTGVAKFKFSTDGTTWSTTEYTSGDSVNIDYAATCYVKASTATAGYVLDNQPYATCTYASPAVTVPQAAYFTVTVNRSYGVLKYKFSTDNGASWSGDFSEASFSCPTGNTAKVKATVADDGYIVDPTIIALTADVPATVTLYPTYVPVTLAHYYEDAHGPYHFGDSGPYTVAYGDEHVWVSDLYTDSTYVTPAYIYSGMQDAYIADTTREVIQNVSWTTATLRTYTITWRYLSAYPNTWTETTQEYGYNETPVPPSGIDGTVTNVNEDSREKFLQWDSLAKVTADRTITAEYQRQYHIVIYNTRCTSDYFTDWYNESNTAFTCTWTPGTESDRNNYAWDIHGSKQPISQNIVPDQPRIYRTSADYIYVNITSTNSTASFSGSAISDGWRWVSYDVECTWTADNLYAYDNHGTTTTSQHLTEAGDAYDCPPTHGYYEVSFDVNKYTANNTTDWYPIAQSKTTRFTAINDWSFGGQTVNDYVDISDSVPGSVSATPTYIGIAVTGTHDTIYVNNTERASGWTGIVSVNSSIRWEPDTYYSFTAGATQTNATTTASAPCTYENSPVNIKALSITSNYCASVDKDDDTYYAPNNLTITWTADDHHSFNGLEVGDTRTATLTAGGTFESYYPRYVKIKIESTRCQATLGADEVSSGWIGLAYVATSIDWEADEGYSFAEGITRQRYTSQSVSLDSPYLYSASANYKNVTFNGYYCAPYLNGTDLITDGYRLIGAHFTWFAANNYGFDSSGTNYLNDTITVSQANYTASVSHMNITISGTHCSTTDTSGWYDIGHVIDWTANTNWAFDDQGHTTTYLEVTEEVFNYAPEAEYIYVTVDSGTGCSANKSTGWYLYNTQCTWTADLYYAFSSTGAPTATDNFITPGGNYYQEPTHCYLTVSVTNCHCDTSSGWYNIEHADSVTATFTPNANYSFATGTTASTYSETVVMDQPREVRGDPSCVIGQITCTNCYATDSILSTTIPSAINYYFTDGGQITCTGNSGYAYSASSTTELKTWSINCNLSSDPGFVQVTLDLTNCHYASGHANGQYVAKGTSLSTTVDANTYWSFVAGAASTSSDPKPTDGASTTITASNVQSPKTLYASPEFCFGDISYIYSTYQRNSAHNLHAENGYWRPGTFTVYALDGYAWNSAGTVTTETYTWSENCQLRPKPTWYKVTITALGCKENSLYLSVDNDATSGSPSGTYFDIRFTVYGFAELNDRTTQYSYYAQPTWTQVSPTHYCVDDPAGPSDPNIAVTAQIITNKYTITWRYQDTYGHWTVTNTEYNYGDIPGTDTPATGTVPTPTDVTSGNNKQVVLGWDDLSEVVANRTITCTYKQQYNVTFDGTNCTTTSTDGWYDENTIITWTANPRWSFGGSNVSDTSQSTITQGGTLAASPGFCKIDLTSIHCHADKTDDTIYAIGTNITWTADTNYAFDANGAPTQVTPITSSTYIYEAECTHGYYEITTTNCTAYSDSQCTTPLSSGYFPVTAAGSTKTTYFKAGAGYTFSGSSTTSDAASVPGSVSATATRIQLTVSFAGPTYGVWTYPTKSAEYGDELEVNGTTITCYAWNSGSARWTNTVVKGTDDAQWTYDTPIITDGDIASLTSDVTVHATDDRHLKQYTITFRYANAYDSDMTYDAVNWTSTNVVYYYGDTPGTSTPISGTVPTPSTVTNTAGTGKLEFNAWNNLTTVTGARNIDATYIKYLKALVINSPYSTSSLNINTWYSDTLAAITWTAKSNYSYNGVTTGDDCDTVTWLTDGNGTYTAPLPGYMKATYSGDNVSKIWRYAGSTQETMNNNSVYPVSTVVYWTAETSNNNYKYSFDNTSINSPVTSVSETLDRNKLVYDNDASYIYYYITFTNTHCDISSPVTPTITSGNYVLAGTVITWTANTDTNIKYSFTNSDAANPTTTSQETISAKANYIKNAQYVYYNVNIDGSHCNADYNSGYILDGTTITWTAIIATNYKYSFDDADVLNPVLTTTATVNSTVAGTTIKKYAQFVYYKIVVNPTRCSINSPSGFTSGTFVLDDTDIVYTANANYAFDANGEDETTITSSSSIAGVTQTPSANYYKVTITRATGVATYQYSVDGGTNWSAATSTASTVVYAAVGQTVKAKSATAQTNYTVNISDVKSTSTAGATLTLIPYQVPVYVDIKFEDHAGSPSVIDTIGPYLAYYGDECRPEDFVPLNYVTTEWTYSGKAGGEGRFYPTESYTTWYQYATRELTTYTISWKYFATFADVQSGTYTTTTTTVEYGTVPTIPNAVQATRTNNDNNARYLYTGVSPTVVAVTSNATYTVTPPTLQYYITISTISHVSITGSSSSDWYNNGASVTLKSAQIQDTTTITISYNANGGTSTPESQTTTPTRNYTLKGWNKGSASISNNAETTATVNGAATYSPKTPTAQAWNYPAIAEIRSAITHEDTSVSGYTVTYAKGDSTDTNVPAPQTSIRIKHWHWNDWHINSPSGTAVAAGSTYTPTENITLYAGWTNTYTNGTIQLATNNLTFSNANRNTYTITFNGNSPSTSGHTCTVTGVSDPISAQDTWSRTADGWDIGASGSYYTPNADITATAQWAWNTRTGNATITLPSLPTTTDTHVHATYTITYNVNGGSNLSKDSDTTTLNYKWEASYWNTKADGTGTNYSVGNTISNTTTTLYAKWADNSKGVTPITLATATPPANDTSPGYTVTFDSTGGSTVASKTATDTYSYSAKGWYTASSDGTKVGDQGASFSPYVTRTLYAQWNRSLSTYGSITAPTSPTKTGYTFANWWTDASGGTKITFPYQVTSNQNLYAHWLPNSYTLTMTANHGSVKFYSDSNYTTEITTAAYDSTVYVKVNPDAYYYYGIKRQYHGSYYEVGAYTVTGIISGNTINIGTVTCSPFSYTYGATSSNGVCTPGTTSAVTYGSDTSITVNANVHYYYISTSYYHDQTYTYTNKALTTANYTFSTSTADGTATANFVTNCTAIVYTYSITSADSAYCYHGSTQPTTASTTAQTGTYAERGTTYIYYKINPKTHYEINYNSQRGYNGSPIGDVEHHAVGMSFTFTDSTRTATLAINCTAISYTTTCTLGNTAVQVGTSTSSYSNSLSYTYANLYTSNPTIYVKVTPNVHYEMTVSSTRYYNGSPLSGSSYYVKGNTFTFNDQYATAVCALNTTTYPVIAITYTASVSASNSTCKLGTASGSYSATISLTYQSKTIYLQQAPAQHYEVTYSSTRYYYNNNYTTSVNYTSFIFNDTTSVATYALTACTATTYSWSVNSSNSNYCYYIESSTTSGTPTTRPTISKTYSAMSNYLVYKINPAQHYYCNSTSYIYNTPYSSYVSKASCNFNYANKTATYTKNCTAITYTISGTASNGTVSWNPATATYGANTTWTITANSGYSRPSTYTGTLALTTDNFSISDSNRTASCLTSLGICTPNNYTLTIHRKYYAITGVQSKASTTTSDTDTSITVTYNTSYSYTYSKTGYASQTTSGTWTTVGDGEVTLTLSPVQYTVSQVDISNASESLNYSWSYYNQSVSQTVEPNIGYEYMKDNGTTVTRYYHGYPYTRSATITANYEFSSLTMHAFAYTVSGGSAAHGTVSWSGNNQIGTNATWTITADNYYARPETYTGTKLIGTILFDLDDANKTAVYKSSQPNLGSCTPLNYTIQNYSRTGGTVYWSTSSITTSGGSTTLEAPYNSTVYWRIAASTGYDLPATYYGSMTLNTTNFTISSTSEAGTATYKGSAINNCTVKQFTLTISVTGAGYGTYNVRRTSSPLAGAATGPLSNGATIYYGDVLTGSSSANSQSATTWGAWGTVSAPSVTSTGDAATGNMKVKNEDSATVTLYYNTVNSTGDAISLGSTASGGTKDVAQLSFNTTYYCFATKTVSRSGTYYTYSKGSDNYTGTNGVTGNVTASFTFSQTTNSTSESTTGYSSVTSHNTGSRNSYSVKISAAAHSTITACSSNLTIAAGGTYASGTVYWGVSVSATATAASGYAYSTTPTFTTVYNATVSGAIDDTAAAPGYGKFTWNTNTTQYSTAAATSYYALTSTTISRTYETKTNYAFNTSGLSSKSLSTTFSLAGSYSPGHPGYVNATSYSGTRCSTTASTGWKSYTSKITWTAGAAYAFDTSNTTTTQTTVVAGQNVCSADYVKRYTLTISVTDGQFGSYQVKRTDSPNQGAASGVLSNGATIYYGDVLTGTHAANPSSYTNWAPASITKPTATSTGDATTGNITVKNEHNATVTLYYNTTNATGGTSLGSTASGSTKTKTGLSFSTTYYISAKGSQSRTRTDYIDNSTYSGTSSVIGNVNASFSFSSSSATETQDKWSTTNSITTAARNTYTITWTWQSSYGNWTTGTTTVAYGDTPSPEVVPSTVVSGNSRQVFNAWDDLSAVTAARTITATYTQQYKATISGTNCTPNLSTNWYNSGTTITWTAGDRWSFGGSSVGDTTTATINSGGNYSKSPGYCKVSISSTHCTANKSNNTIYAVGTTITWTASTNYAFTSGGGTTTSTDISTSTYSYSAECTYGYYTITTSHCTAYSNSSCTTAVSSGWFAVTSSKTTYFKADTGYSFSGSSTTSASAAVPGSVSATATRITWSYTINLGTGQASYKYKIDSGSYITKTANYTITGIDYGSTVTIVGVSANTGYTADTSTYTRTYSNAGGTLTITATRITWTASVTRGTGVATYRYSVDGGSSWVTGQTVSSIANIDYAATLTVQAYSASSGYVLDSQPTANATYSSQSVTVPAATKYTITVGKRGGVATFKYSTDGGSTYSAAQTSDVSVTCAVGTAVKAYANTANTNYSVNTSDIKSSSTAGGSLYVYPSKVPVTLTMWIDDTSPSTLKETIILGSAANYNSSITNYSYLQRGDPYPDNQYYYVSNSYIYRMIITGEQTSTAGASGTSFDIHWEGYEANSYTVSWSASNGSWNSTTAITGVKWGTAVTRSGNTVTVGSTSRTYTPASTTVSQTAGTPTYSNVSTVYGSKTITASTPMSTRYYTIKWYNGSTLLETDSNVQYNATLTYNSATPTKASTAQYNYTFANWRLGSTSGSVVISGSTKNPGSTSTTTINIYATFNSSVRYYTVTYQAKYGGSVVASQTASKAYGTNVTSTTYYPTSSWTYGGYVYSGGTSESVAVDGPTTVSTTYTSKTVEATPIRLYYHGSGAEIEFEFDSFGGDVDMVILCADGVNHGTDLNEWLNNFMATAPGDPDGSFYVPSPAWGSPLYYAAVAVDVRGDPIASYYPVVQHWTIAGEGD